MNIDSFEEFLILEDSILADFFPMKTVKILWQKLLQIDKAAIRLYVKLRKDGRSKFDALKIASSNFKIDAKKFEDLVASLGPEPEAET